jgi:NAD(P)-dependent dehydrogenase (short-subunit alcohol dehydrogenase family)
VSEVLAVFGGGKGSLGENFLTHAVETYYGDNVVSFSLDNGYDCTDPGAMQVARDITARVMQHDNDNELHIVNFVGMMDNGKIVDYSYDSFKRMMFTNLYSLFVIAKIFMPLLAENNGRFITIGSNAGEMGFTGMGAYCATKFAVQGFIQCMAKEMAPFNVPVNVVNPGAFEFGASTMSSLQVGQFMEQTGKSQGEVETMLTSRIPMKRLATNEDLNSMLIALLVNYPRYYTGQAISLSGGMVMG